MNKMGFTYVEPASYISEEMKEILFAEDYERIRAFVSKYPWPFAKTYVKTAPHEYIVT